MGERPAKSAAAYAYLHSASAGGAASRSHRMWVLTRIFAHGFATHSNGPDTGATFTLQLPLDTLEAAA